MLPEVGRRTPFLANSILRVVNNAYWKGKRRSSLAVRCSMSNGSVLHYARSKGGQNKGPRQGPPRAMSLACNEFCSKPSRMPISQRPSARLLAGFSTMDYFTQIATRDLTGGVIIRPCPGVVCQPESPVRQ